MTTDIGYQIVSLDRLHESPLNPRKHYDKAGLEELAASIRVKGILTPLLVRVNAAGYEIGAGHRRARAAKLAGLTEAPVVVRPMSDDDFLELLTVENLQREDLHPLEEAQGYQQLLATKRYDVARVAEKVGRSVKYIYDRVKLLALIKPAQQLFLDGKFSAGHAILLARLRPEDQRRAIGLNEKGKLVTADDWGAAPVGGGVFAEEHTLWDEHRDPEGKTDAEVTLKPRSVRELDAWITEHVKFHADEADPVLFPETVGAVQRAKEETEKVVSVTYDYTVPPDARDGQKVLGPRSWKPATGQGKDKACEHAVTGVIVIGSGRGEALKVCIAKDKCKVHWAEWQKERAARAKGAAKSGGKTGEDRWEAERRKQEAERKREEAEEARWKKALPAILEAVAAQVKKAPAAATGILADLIVDACAPERRGDGKLKAGDFLPRGKSAEDLVRHTAFCLLMGEATTYWRARRDFPKTAKAFGIDVKKIVDTAAPLVGEPKAEAAPAAAGKKKPAKKPAKAKAAKGAKKKR